MTATVDTADESWRRAFARQDWPDLLASAVRHASQTLAVAAPYVLLDIAVVRDGDVVVLDIRYRTGADLLVGLRWDVSDVPPAGGPDSVSALDVAAWVARWIVQFELGEPLGTYAQQLTVDADGVGWWGRGYAVP